MELNVRKLTEEDYEIFSDWWIKWEWPVMPKEFLPDNGKGGLMVEKNGNPIVCGFVYENNSKFWIFEWMISNPEYRENDRKEAIEMLINNAENVCKDMGYKYKLSIGRNKHLIETHKKLGWFVDPKQSHEIIKTI